jgi:hypothetical protein
MLTLTAAEESSPVSLKKQKPSKKVAATKKASAETPKEPKPKKAAKEVEKEEEILEIDDSDDSDGEDNEDVNLAKMSARFR